jgi:lysophospholipase L1-like esterase
LGPENGRRTCAHTTFRYARSSDAPPFAEFAVQTAIERHACEGGAERKRSLLRARPTSTLCQSRLVTPTLCPPLSARTTISVCAVALAFLSQCSAWFESAANNAEDGAATTPAKLRTTEISPSDGRIDAAAAQTEAAELGLPSTVTAIAATPSPFAGEPARPALDSELHRLRHLAQKRVLGHEPPLSQRALPYAQAARDLSADGSESPVALGHFVTIENEVALQHFHTALSRLVAGTDDDKKVRILAYGASHTQSDLYTGYLRTYLQSRFGDGGQGFVLLGRVNKWYRTLDTYATHQGLSVLHARYKPKVQNEPLGLFGAALVGKYSDGHAEILTAKESISTRFELHYLAHPNGGDFTLQVDGKQRTRVSTRADSERPGYHVFQATPGAHRISVRLSGNGPVRLFGIVGESDAPGVVVDTLGISGARMSDQLRWREDFWAEAVKRRAPDLVTFAYGTNETKDTNLSIASYEAELRTALSRLRRAAPEASCVLLAPFDLASSERPRLLQIIDAQRRVSREFFCGFWDGHAFMGGDGAIRRWIQAKPPLASTDHIHLTRRGYVYAGIAVGDALMRAYDIGNVQGPAAPGIAVLPVGPAPLAPP